MDVGDCLARIAESQVGTRGDLQSGRAALYGYLLATDVKLGAFGPEIEKTGFGEKTTRISLLNPGANALSSRLHLITQQPPPELPVIFRIHNWCAAFVDWCVMQLLINSPHATSLSLAHRPKTALAWGFWSGESINTAIARCLMTLTRCRTEATSWCSTFITPASVLSRL